MYRFKFNIKADNPDPVSKPNEEGYKIVKRLWDKFYREAEKNFYSEVSVSGTYKSGDGYKFVIWSVIIAIAGLADGANIENEKDADIKKDLLKYFDTAYAILNRHKSKEIKGAYPASEDFPGNKDIYYDDDAQVGSALVFFYKATKDEKYLNDAIDTLEFLITGQNDDKNIAFGGGVWWSYDKEYVSAISTSESSLVALRVYEFLDDDDNRKTKYLYFAIRNINWILKYLRDPDSNLIWDGISGKDNEIGKTTYTYNSGTVLSALTYIYRYTKDKKWAEAADEIVESVLNHSKDLFDRNYQDTHEETIKKYWTDHSYFIQLLFEGLADYLTTFSKDSNISVEEETLKRIEYELERHLGLFRRYSYDISDGLYYTNFQPYKISKEIYKQYIEDFENPNISFDPDSEDREDNGKDVADRPLVKTLIGAGSAARIWFQAGRIFDKIDKKYFENPYN